MKKWYESLFENYGKNYDNESFTKGTIGECDFIEKEIDFDTKNNISKYFRFKRRSVEFSYILDPISLK